jgi:hypothetical protein
MPLLKGSLRDDDVVPGLSWISEFYRSPLFGDVYIMPLTGEIEFGMTIAKSLWTQNRLKIHLDLGFYCGPP